MCIIAPWSFGSYNIPLIFLSSLGGIQPESESELVATAMATAVANGVAKDVLYLNTCSRGNLAVAVAVAPNSDKA